MMLYAMLKGFCDMGDTIHVFISKRMKNSEGCMKINLSQILLIPTEPDLSGVNETEHA